MTTSTDSRLLMFLLLGWAAACSSPAPSTEGTPSDSPSETADAESPEAGAPPGAGAGGAPSDAPVTGGTASPGEVPDDPRVDPDAEPPNDDQSDPGPTGDSPSRPIYAGGVSGCGQLSIPENSDAFRASGGHIFIHSVGWMNHTTEAEKKQIIQLWADHEWGIEMGFSANNYTARQNAYVKRYLKRGIQAEFITVNAYSSGRVPQVDDWKRTIQAYYDKGVKADTPIYATFEYQNIPPHHVTLHKNYVSDRTDFQQIIEASGGLTLDVPPTVYFRRVNSSNANVRKYHDWILDAIDWAQSRGHRVGIIVSPNSSKTKYDEDTKAFLDVLKEHEALPDFFIVENYSPEDPASYANEVGDEDTPHHQLGAARLMQTTWLAE